MPAWLSPRPSAIAAGSGWPRALALAVVVALLGAVLVWVGRSLVPPAPLFLADKQAARDVQDLIPQDPIAGSVSAATVAAWGGGLAAYTAVHAPAGLREPIEHVWWKDGQVIARVPLSPVLGGRAEGFRTWSRKSDLGTPLAGAYAVDVRTASGPAHRPPLVHHHAVRVRGWRPSGSKWL